MDVQARTFGLGLVPRLSRGVLALLLLLLLAPLSGARAGQGPRVLDYHATVINGHFVGSAFMIRAEVAVTNAHVLRGLRPGDLVSVVASGPGHPRAEARVIAISSRIDLGLIKVPSGLMPMVLGSDAFPVTGLHVNSAGIDASRHETPTPSEATGFITNPALEIPAFGPGLVAAMPMARPGYSGGPMLDDQGRLVGMLSAIRTGGPLERAANTGQTGDEGDGLVEAFALDARTIRAEVDRLLARRD